MIEKVSIRGIRTIKAVLCTVFFLSGAAALIFEYLWFRLSGLVIGNSVLAASIVLASFMCGLALGNALVAFHGHRIRFPLRFYALLEGVIAVSGASLVLLLPHLTKISIFIFRHFLAQPLMLNILRAMVAMCLMIIPTTAMGATLPVLVKVLYAKKHNFGNVLGVLYGFNTLGAVIGVVVSELFFVKWFGIRNSGLVAAIFNILAATIALGFARHIESGPGTFLSPETNTAHPEFSPRTIRLMTAGFLSGLIMLALEVIWFRFMRLFFFGHSLNFAIMLAVVLAGISCGGLFASRWFELRKDANIFLIAMLALNGILINILYARFDTFIYFFLEYTGGAFVLFFSLYLMFPISFISGIIFTMIGKELHQELKIDTWSSGLLTMSNTLGGMVGSLAGGLLFIPVLGIERSFVLLAGLYGCIICLIISKKQYIQTPRVYTYHFIMTGMLILSLVLFPFGMMENVFLDVPVARYFAIGERRIASREGANETVQYLQNDLLGKPHYYRLVTNGHSMAVTSISGKRYMKFFVYLPVAIHPKPRSALLIGYGCGATAKALTDTKYLQKIQVVDTSKDIIEMSSIIFPDPEENPIFDPRLTVRIEDGRFFLLTTNNEFDIITAEPPPPKGSGIVNLYTQEFFQLIYDRLSDGGVLTYWLPVHMLEVEETKAIVRGFCNVFDNCSLWTGSRHEWMMVGIKDLKESVPEDQFVRQWNDPVVGLEMRKLGFMSPEEFGALFIADGQRLRNWISKNAPLVDNYPHRLSYKRVTLKEMKELYPVYWKFMHPDISRKNFIESWQINKIWPERLRKEAEKFFFTNHITMRIFGRKASIVDLHKCIHNPLLRSYILWMLNSDEYAQEIVAGEFEEKQEETGDILRVYEHLAAGAVADGEYIKAEYYYRLMGETEKYIDLRLYLLLLAGDEERARQLGEEYINLHDTGKTQRRSEINRKLDWLRKIFGKSRAFVPF